MTLEQRLTALAQAIATDVKTLISTRGNLSVLTTTEKSNLVGAINEVNAALGSSVIDDNASSVSEVKTYSANKITSLLSGLKGEILGGASASYDTLLEIQNILTTDGTAISGLLTAIAKRVAVDTAQSFTVGEQTQARSNIGAQEAALIGNTDRNLALDYTTARDA